jgi:hypothetical protein
LFLANRAKDDNNTRSSYVAVVSPEKRFMSLKRERIGNDSSHSLPTTNQVTMVDGTMFLSMDEQQRTKYRRVSCDLWRKACQSSSNGYDNSLPTLEEAALLFGYAKGIKTSSLLPPSLID